MDILSLLPYFTLLSVGFSIYATLQSRFTSKENARRDQDIALLQKQSELFWDMVKQHMTTVLHSPHTPDRDKLLEKIQADEQLNDEELDSLSEDLKGVINDPDEIPGNRVTAFFLLACIERYRQRVAEFVENRESQSDTSLT